MGWVAWSPYHYALSPANYPQIKDGIMQLAPYEAAKEVSSALYKLNHGKVSHTESRLHASSHP